MLALRTSETVALVYLLYLAALAWVTPLSGGRRITVTLIALSSAVAIATLPRLSVPAAAWVRDWAPSAYIVAGYWLSGAFFRKPMPTVEQVLLRGDRWLYNALGFGGFVERAPRWLLEAFELAYASVTPLVPLGFLVVILLMPSFNADRFWAPVVASELACYAMLPWIQSRPPRALGDHVEIDRRPLAVRRLNRRILANVSIQVNTVPSGHAAGAVAVAFAVTAQAPWVGALFFLVAIAICIGAVAGRYHYAIDVAAGLAIAVVVTAALR
jgi:membrane-associated phospholipid phosphatase